MSINEDTEETVRNIVEAALLAAGEPVSMERLVALFDPGADARAVRAEQHADADADADADAGTGADGVTATDAAPSVAGDADVYSAAGSAAGSAADSANAAFQVEGAEQSGQGAAPGVGREEVAAALAALAELYADRGLELKEVASGWRVQVRADLAPWIGRLWEARPPRYSRALLETLALIAYQQPVTRGDIENVRGVSVSSGIIRTLLDRDWIRIVGHRDVPGRPALYGTTRTFLDYFDLRSLDQLPPLAEIRDLAKLNEEFGFTEPDAAPAGEEDDERGAEVVPLRAVLGQFETPSDEGEFAEPDPVKPDAGADDDDTADAAGALAAERELGDAGDLTASEGRYDDERLDEDRLHEVRLHEVRLHGDGAPAGADQQGAGDRDADAELLADDEAPDADDAANGTPRDGERGS